MHLAHVLVAHELGDVFFQSLASSGVDLSWQVPPNAGEANPYLKPRGGTKMKKSNKRLLKGRTDSIDNLR